MTSEDEVELVKRIVNMLTEFFYVNNITGSVAATSLSTFECMCMLQTIEDGKISHQEAIEILKLSCENKIEMLNEGMK